MSADDSTTSTCGKKVQEIELKLNNDLQEISNWCDENNELQKFMSMCSNVRTEAWLTTTSYVHKHNFFSAILLSHHIQRDATISPPSTTPANKTVKTNNSIFWKVHTWNARRETGFYTIPVSFYSRTSLLMSSLRCPRVTLIASIHVYVSLTVRWSIQKITHINFKYIYKWYTRWHMSNTTHTEMPVCFHQFTKLYIYHSLCVWTIYTIFMFAPNRRPTCHNSIIITPRSIGLQQTRSLEMGLLHFSLVLTCH